MSSRPSSPSQTSNGWQNGSDMFPSLVAAVQPTPRAIVAELRDALQETARVAREPVELEVASNLEPLPFGCLQPIRDRREHAARPVRLQAHRLDVDAAVLDHEKPVARDEAGERAQCGGRRLISV